MMVARSLPLRPTVSVVCVVASVIALGACGNGNSPTPAAPGPPTTMVFGPVATRAPLPGLGPDTATTAAPDTIGSTLPPIVDETTTTLVPTTGAVTTTTEPPAVQGLELSGAGIGSAIFGADPDGVIDYVSALLGSNTSDTGWVEPLTFGVCEGTEVRKVEWGRLSLLFSDLSQFASGRRHFMGWEYGKRGEIGDEPAGLRTAGGVTLGSRVVDLLAEFPDASANAGDPALERPDNFFVSLVFYGLLTGPNLDDYVTVMFGGYGCGE
jgi:hypothetical protein